MTFIFGNGQDGTVTISANTDLGATNIKQYENLTVNNGVTLSGNSGLTIFVRTQLSNSGTIKPNQTNVVLGVTGTAGGSIYVFARVATGTGTISAAGSTAAQGSGANGGSPLIEGVAQPSPAPTAGAQPNGGAAGGTYSVDEIVKKARALLSLGQLSGYNIYGGCGAGGAGAIGSNAGGGGGAGSLVDAGGAGGNGGVNGVSSTSGNGGNGGSSGGLIVFLTHSIIGYTFDASGGVGGNGTAGTGANAGGGGGGGGGAGGVIVIISRRFNGTVTVTGGAGGTGAAGAGTGTGGANGTVGSRGRVFLWDLGAVA